MNRSHFQFSVLIYRDPAVGLESPWVVHALNWDLVTVGDSPSNALEMLQDAIEIVIREDEADGIDPSQRPSAPKPLWTLFHQTQSKGSVVRSDCVDGYAQSRDGNVVITTTLYMVRINQTVQSDIPAETPPPFMIDKIRNGGDRLGV